MRWLLVLALSVVVFALTSCPDDGALGKSGTTPAEVPAGGDGGGGAAPSGS